MFRNPVDEAGVPVVRMRGWARGTAIGAAALSVLIGVAGGVVLTAFGSVT